MSFLARWLSNAVTLSLSLACAVLAMQAPALTDAYSSALLQVSEDGRRDIDQRLAAAARHYRLSATDQPQLIEALRAREPSNAETVVLSVQRMAALRAAYDRVTAAGPIFRPAVALLDAATDPSGYKRDVLRIAVESFVPAAPFTTAALAYAMLGVLVGSFLAQLAMGLLAATIGRGLRLVRRRPIPWYVPQQR